METQVRGGELSSWSRVIKWTCKTPGQGKLAIWQCCISFKYFYTIFLVQLIEKVIFRSQFYSLDSPVINYLTMCECVSANIHKLTVHQ